LSQADSWIAANMTGTVPDDPNAVAAQAAADAAAAAASAAAAGPIGALLSEPNLIAMWSAANGFTATWESWYGNYTMTNNGATSPALVFSAGPNGASYLQWDAISDELLITSTVTDTCTFFIVAKFPATGGGTLNDLISDIDNAFYISETNVGSEGFDVNVNGFSAHFAADALNWHFYEVYIDYTIGRAELRLDGVLLGGVTGGAVPLTTGFSFGCDDPNGSGTVFGNLTAAEVWWFDGAATAGLRSYFDTYANFKFGL
jgi:hypothetical protein